MGTESWLVIDFDSIEAIELLGNVYFNIFFISTNFLFIVSFKKRQT